MNKEVHPKMYLYRRIVEAKLFIDKNYHQKIDLNTISDQACFSKYHFLRLFKKAYGNVPRYYPKAADVNGSGYPDILWWPNFISSSPAPDETAWGP